MEHFFSQTLSVAKNVDTSEIDPENAKGVDHDHNRVVDHIGKADPNQDKPEHVSRLCTDVVAVEKE